MAGFLFGALLANASLNIELHHRLALIMGLEATMGIIEPIFITNTPNETLLLGELDANLTADGLSFTGQVFAELRFRPTDRLVFRMTLPSRSSGNSVFELTSNLQLHLAGAEAPIAVLPFNVSTNKKTTQVQMIPRVSKVRLRGSDDDKLTKARLHLINFPHFYSLNSSADGDISAEVDGGKQRIGRVVLRSEKWVVEIQSVEHLDSLYKKLSSEGGFAITHTIEITSLSSDPFNVLALTKLINQLRLLLSFARGQWISPFAIYGWHEDRLVLQDWSTMLADQWASARSWFDIHHGNFLAELFPGFINALEDGTTGDAIKKSLYWYIRSNRGGAGSGIDSGILLTQAALERISYAILSSRGLQIPKRAADKIRHALETLQIATSIPAETRNLFETSKTGKLQDGPHAIATIRNELVHPESRASASSLDIGALIPEVWTLSQLYYELLLLRISGYKGKYSNRLRSKWVGEVEAVPWA